MKTLGYLAFLGAARSLEALAIIFCNLEARGVVNWAVDFVSKASGKAWQDLALYQKFEAAYLQKIIKVI